MDNEEHYAQPPQQSEGEVLMGESQQFGDECSQQPNSYNPMTGEQNCVQPPQQSEGEILMGEGQQWGAGQECCATLAPPPAFLEDEDGTRHPVVYDRAADLARIDPGPRKGVLPHGQRNDHQ